MAEDFHNQSTMTSPYFADSSIPTKPFSEYFCRHHTESTTTCPVQIHHHMPVCMSKDFLYKPSSNRFQRCHHSKKICQHLSKLAQVIGQCNAPEVLETIGPLEKKVSLFLATYQHRLAEEGQAITANVEEVVEDNLTNAGNTNAPVAL